MQIHSSLQYKYPELHKHDNYGCVKVWGDRPSSGPPECVNRGATDRPIGRLCISNQPITSRHSKPEASERIAPIRQLRTAKAPWNATRRERREADRGRDLSRNHCIAVTDELDRASDRGARPRRPAAPRATPTTTDDAGHLSRATIGDIHTRCE